MRIIVLFLFVGFFAALPVYLLDNMVMPQLMGLHETYSSFDETAQQIANSK